MTNTNQKFISPEQINFTNECLTLYKDLCTPLSREQLFTKCVKERLNKLLIDNTNRIDKVLSDFEQFTDSLVRDDIPFNRCENYTRMVKEKNKSSILYMKKLFNTYTKSCRMSTLVLKRLIKEVSV